VAETTTANCIRAELRVSLTAGRRGVGWPLGRLVVDDQELTVRSAGTRWIPARSVGKNAVGDISVVRRIVISLPILRWRQVEVVRFDPRGPFADVSVRLSPAKRIVDVLRAAGYFVIDQRM
jgi:hypothetical protein